LETRPHKATKGRALTLELACARGLHERDRRADSASERVRLNGTRLKHSIKTGPFRSYIPGAFQGRAEGTSPHQFQWEP